MAEIQSERSDGTVGFDSIKPVNGDFLDPGITSWAGRPGTSHAATVAILAN